MSRYARSIQNGVLVRVKQAAILRWRWYFNCSEEDQLNKMKNDLLKARQLVKDLSRRIPKAEDQLKKEKQALQDWMNSNGVNRGMPWRDSYRPRRNPVRLIEDTKTARKKSDRATGPPKRKPVPIAQITTPP